MCLVAWRNKALQLRWELPVRGGHAALQMMVLYLEGRFI